VGETDGRSVGESVGFLVGETDGRTVGESLGSLVGDSVGVAVIGSHCNVTSAHRLGEQYEHPMLGPLLTSNVSWLCGAT